MKIGVRCHFEETKETTSTSSNHSRKSPYRKLLMERIVSIEPRPDVRNLRQDITIILLKATIQQQDPRRCQDISFIDLVDDYNQDAPQLTANWLASQHTDEEKNDSQKQCIKIRPISLPEEVQIVAHTHENARNTVIPMENDIVLDPLLLNLQKTSIEDHMEDIIFPDTFETISLESYYNILFVTNKDLKSTQTNENDNFLPFQLDLAENRPLLAIPFIEEILSYLYHFLDENNM